jgi:mycothiol synthase
MAARWKQVEVDVKNASPDFWARYHAYRRLRHEESRPDDPLTPDEIVEKEIKRDDPFEYHLRYEISRDGLMLSWFGAGGSKPDSPGWDTNKHILWADCWVRREHRRHGIASSWIPLVLEIMERHSQTTLSMGTEEESGHAFLKWLSAESKFTGAENRLKLADVDWKMMRRWVEEGQRRSPETRLEVYDGRVPKSMWEEYSIELSTMLNSMPWEDLDHGDIVINPDVMAHWYERNEEAGRQNHVILAREPDGVISGITDMLYATYSPTIVHQGFTGVRASARGRGLGKWLKAAMAIRIHELYPQAQWFSTDNAGSNAPMLAINRKMGFKEFRVGSEYQISRERLAARMKELAGAS